MTNVMLVLMVCMVSSAAFAADNYWNNNGGDNLWSNADNWSLGVPDDTAGVNLQIRGIEPCIVDDSVPAGQAFTTYLASDASHGILEVTDGEVDFLRQLIIGQTGTGTVEVSISGGIVNVLDTTSPTQSLRIGGNTGDGLLENIEQKAFLELKNRYDSDNAGFLPAPKFLMQELLQEARQILPKSAPSVTIAGSMPSL